MQPESANQWFSVYGHPAVVIGGQLFWLCSCQHLIIIMFSRDVSRLACIVGLKDVVTEIWLQGHPAEPVSGYKSIQGLIFWKHYSNWLICICWNKYIPPLTKILASSIGVEVLTDAFLMKLKFYFAAHVKPAIQYFRRRDVYSLYFFVPITRFNI